MNGIEFLISLFMLANSSMGPMQTHHLPKPPTLENLPDAVIIKATSKGCTKKRHFRVITASDGQTRVLRLKQDRCTQPPRLEEFRYSHEQLGMTPPNRLQQARLAEK